MSKEKLVISSKKYRGDSTVISIRLPDELVKKLDTIADVCFVGATLCKLLFSIQMPIWLWLWIGTVLLIKLTNIISGFLYQKMFVAKHTTANKITGILFFLFPFSLSFLPLEFSGTVVCAMATVAAIQERYQQNLQTRKPLQLTSLYWDEIAAVYYCSLALI